MRHLLVLLSVMAAPVWAQDAASGAQITAALSGNTVMGSMSASGAYAEYYAPDGAIRAADYAGTWAVQADQMCFTYGEDPATCWAVQISGNQVTWLVGGAAEGVGTIVPGNPNNW